MRWRCLMLHYVYSTSLANCSLILGPSEKSIKRWMRNFVQTGDVYSGMPRQRSARWNDDVYAFVQAYIQEHPCFYIQELQDELSKQFPDLKNISVSTICRALRHDLRITRKVLEKRARESIPEQLKEFYVKLRPVYSYPEQLVFIDESSKDGRDCLRRYGRSRVNTPAIVNQPFQRGSRVSILAAFDTSGFFAWETTPDTFTRQKFHSAFIRSICPFLQPWPMPRSIVILDNAKIHMYRELEEVIHKCGAMLLYLPPYSPQLNPIEKGFSLLKQWLTKYADMVFRQSPEKVLEAAMPLCTNFRNAGHNFYASCGYGENDLIKDCFYVYYQSTSDGRWSRSSMSWLTVA